ncbi:MAG: hypothetical protein R3F37_12615 [Candidatus Competibacteraceae bacterium]
MLAEHFLNNFARKMGKPLTGIAPASLERLIHYPWPGKFGSCRTSSNRP